MWKQSLQSVYCLSRLTRDELIFNVKGTEFFCFCIDIFDISSWTIPTCMIYLKYTRAYISEKFTSCINEVCKRLSGKGKSV